MPFFPCNHNNNNSSTGSIPFMQYTLETLLRLTTVLSQSMPPKFSAHMLQYHSE